MKSLLKITVYHLVQGWTESINLREQSSVFRVLLIFFIVFY